MTQRNRRARDLGITIGLHPTGQWNAITDVAGVLVGHATVHSDSPAIIRSGVTLILPQPDILERDYFAGTHVLNGSGELTGAMWIDESGLISTPIALTATHSLGAVRDALPRLAAERGRPDRWWLPAVGETYDGWLSDGPASPIDIGSVRKAFADARSGVVGEGSAGGGTGMICHGFKGGVGTSSRRVSLEGSEYVVGVLVQANYGLRDQLVVDGVKVGRHIGGEIVQVPDRNDITGGSSIIVIIATDAPLIGTQCARLARRAGIGLGRAGGLAHDGSGDIFLAFSTANAVDPKARAAVPVSMLPNPLLNSLFAAVADCTEESILNALLAAEDMIGRSGRIVRSLPYDLLEEVLRKR